MHKLESVLENETHKIILNLEIQKGYIILDKRKDLIRKVHFSSSEFAIPAEYKVKVKVKEGENIPGSSQCPEEAVEHESDGNTSGCGGSWNGLQRHRK